MNNLNSAILTSTLTIIAGLIVFLISQLFLKFVLEPLIEYKKIRSKIVHNLKFYSNIYNNPADFHKKENYADNYFEYIEKTSVELRNLACEFIACVNTIPYLGYRIFRFVPSSKQIKIVEKNLIGLSNSLLDYNSSEINDNSSKLAQLNNTRKKEIIDALNIHSID